MTTVYVKDGLNGQSVTALNNYGMGHNVGRILELPRLNMFERKIHIVFPDEVKVITREFLDGMLNPIFKRSGYATVFHKITMESSGNVHNRAFSTLLQDYRNEETKPKPKPWDKFPPGFKIR
jgi:hypothetical protein